MTDAVRARLSLLATLLASLPGLIGARFMVARYLVASVCALASDMIVFLALDRAGVTPMAAALGGYMAGMGVHWTISVRFVFLGHAARGVTPAQRIGFVASALLGMGVTMALVGVLSAVGVAPAIAKLASVPVSFFTVYAIRKYGVFAAR
ncbi:MAG: GtrA family protein [Sphingobium sp.]|nr:GtrA family protein [Sphingobium sp.]